MTDVNTRRSLLGIVGLFVTAPRLLHAQSSVPGVNDNAVSITGSIDLSGPISNQAKIGFSGAQLYFERLNHQGGVHGRQVVLTLLDDGFDPNRTQANIRKIQSEQKSLAIFGTTGDAQSIAAIELATQLAIPLFGPVCGDHHLRQLNRSNIYFVRASYRDEARKMIQHAITVGYRRIAVVYQDDAFGKAMLSEVQTVAKEIETVVPIAFSISTQGVISSITMKELIDSRPNAIILATIGESFTSFIRSCLSNMTSLPQIYGFSMMAPQVIGRELGERGRGIILTQFVPSIRKKSTLIVAEYLQAHLAAGMAGLPNTLALEGYIMGKIFTEGLRRSGRNLTRERLTASLDNLGAWDVGGLGIRYSAASRAGSSFVDLAVLNGAGELTF